MEGVSATYIHKAGLLRRDVVTDNVVPISQLLYGRLLARWIYPRRPLRSRVFNLSHVRHNGNGSREVAIVADAYGTQLSVEIVYARERSACAFSDDVLVFLVWTFLAFAFVESIQNKPLGCCRLTGIAVVLTGAGSDWKNHQTLKASRGVLKMVACFAHCFLCCEPWLMSVMPLRKSCTMCLPARYCEASSILERMESGGPKRSQK
jgi:hypothetical protein